MEKLKAQLTRTLTILQITTKRKSWIKALGFDYLSPCTAYLVLFINLSRVLRHQEEWVHSDVSV